MSDLEEEGTWRWIDGQLVDIGMFQPWVELNNHDSSYPFGDSRRNNADCGFTHDYDHMLHDSNCDRPFYFVCQLSG